VPRCSWPRVTPESTSTRLPGGRFMAATSGEAATCHRIPAANCQRTPDRLDQAVSRCPFGQASAPIRQPKLPVADAVGGGRLRETQAVQALAPLCSFVAHGASADEALRLPSMRRFRDQFLTT